MLITLLTAALASVAVSGISPSPPEQGMAASWYGPSHGESARRHCRREKDSGRRVCHTMEQWRAIARRIESRQASAR